MGGEVASLTSDVTCSLVDDRGQTYEIRELTILVQVR